ncbi:hypothetical protein AC579_8921, partial [Pseudocercospora musae]
RPLVCIAVLRSKDDDRAQDLSCKLVPVLCLLHRKHSFARITVMAYGNANSRRAGSSSKSEEQRWGTNASMEFLSRLQEVNGEFSYNALPDIPLALGVFPFVRKARAGAVQSSAAVTRKALHFDDGACE